MGHLGRVLHSGLTAYRVSSSKKGRTWVRPASAPHSDIIFVADDKASYGKLVAALDGAKAAGAKVLGFAPEEPGGAVIPAPLPPQ